MTTEERVERTFTVGQAPRLSVSNVCGSITVEVAADGEIQVTAVKHLDGRDDPARTEIDIVQQGDQVTVKTRYRDENGLWAKLRGERVCRVDYTVAIPTRCIVETSQVQGTTHVQGVRGRVKVSAVQGEVRLQEIDGRTQVNVVSAAVAGAGWRGRADVDTVSGPVEIRTAQLSRLKANTVSGDVWLETAVDAAGRYEFNSVSGGVTFYLPPDQGVESRGTSLSGRLRSDLPHQLTRRRWGGWQATINGGGPPVRFTSVSGDLELLAAGTS